VATASAGEPAGSRQRAALRAEYWLPIAGDPKDLPPRFTVCHYFDLWDSDGTLKHIHDGLYVACREGEQRDASPTAAIIDIQSVKSAGRKIDPSGYGRRQKDQRQKAPYSCRYCSSSASCRGRTKGSWGKVGELVLPAVERQERSKHGF
jgi:hypothetical protein